MIMTLLLCMGMLFNDSCNSFNPYITTADTNILVNQQILFNANCDSCSPNSFSWYFGDGNSDFGIAHPTYFYSQAGIYVVELIASDSLCVDSFFIAIHVENPTGIINIVALNNAILDDRIAIYWNLEGQRVLRPVNGIYIEELFGKYFKTIKKIQ